MFQKPLCLLAALVGAFAFSARADDPTPAPEIRTPPAPATPRINGPRVYGARPGHPFFYHLPVTGVRPVKFAATGLPAGLTLDADTGNITGAVGEKGEHAVEFAATNARGTDKATIKLVIGDTICLTPAMGWNSWNHFAGRVSGEDVRAAADAMVASGLIDHGWTYVNIDDCWQGERDAAGNIHGNAKFPDLKALGDYIHGKGLKFGIYSSPGPKTCAGFAGSYQHEDQDARTYADWGVDYVKYDACSYRAIMDEHVRQRSTAMLPAEQQAALEALNKERDELQRNKKRTPEQDARFKGVNTQRDQILKTLDASKLGAIRLEEYQTPYHVFGQSLGKVARDVVYSLCQYGDEDVWNWGASLGGNSWRTTGDISANWKSMSSIGFRQDRLAKFAGPGHWNDPDMLEIGNQGLTPDECYTHMTLWCMLSAPLLIGCDMSKMDPLTVSLFSNDGVLAVDQDALGKQGYRIKTEGTTEVWIKPLAGGSVAVALFNRGDGASEIGASWTEIFQPLNADRHNGSGPHVVDLWRGDFVAIRNNGFTHTVAPHSAELLLVSDY